ncbi:tRNA (Guanine37-N(1)-) methyltransferase [Abditibacterium utsteinense]|uniref:tRNA (guanine-N(1)-)-methyltransferase n=1 Tax=Abditibacterium utsteinense TaxID=1960156 RepID=A0A2S8SVK6_9BACT|nr:tRNA (guanosine(37)-N1)-methyltransferase TrmD [Abditibacterium utsteinense]PQV64819.1 tRNA (Guanine37-N(1)-) methyltransferase [Abditibacterium utsteinense]
MRFDIFTLFPEYFDGPFSSSVLKRAIDAGAISIGLHNMRDWCEDKHRRADDAPFGGGAGMVLKADPVARALESVLNFDVGSKPPCPIIYLSPQGRTLNQKIVLELAAHERIALLCGHYEGIDERAIQSCVTDEISLGDFVLTGGESAAAIVVESVSRFVPGVLGNEASASGDSFSNGMLEAPCYTRPATWREMDVPEVLLSGHHGEIEKWRFREGLRRTMLRRPELVEIAMRELPFSRAQLKIYAELQREIKEIHDESGHPSPG